LKWYYIQLGIYYKYNYVPTIFYKIYNCITYYIYHNIICQVPKYIISTYLQRTKQTTYNRLVNRYYIDFWFDLLYECKFSKNLCYLLIFLKNRRYTGTNNMSIQQILPFCKFWVSYLNTMLYRIGSLVHSISIHCVLILHFY